MRACGVACSWTPGTNRLQSPRRAELSRPHRLNKRQIRPCLRLGHDGERAHRTRTSSATAETRRGISRTWGLSHFSRSCVRLPTSACG
jgi:hypothetical protein